MKKGILKIAALLMASLVLFSTLSFTVQKHLCGGKVADVALFGDLERCNMPDDNHNNHNSGITKESCCQDQTDFVQGSNAELKISNKLQGQTHVFAVFFTYTYLRLFESSEKDSNSYLNYSPPIIVKDIPVLYDTFLI